jgi:hypothetical protein
MTVGARSIDGPPSIAMSKGARDVEAEFPFTDKRMRPEGLGPGPGPCSFDRDNRNGDGAADTARRPAHEE